MSPYKLYTIGYTTFPAPEEFIQVLKKYNINALVDVRSSPYSQRYECFNRENIRHALKEEGLEYVFLGDELGARPNNLALYTDGVADFSKMQNSETFLNGCRRVRLGLEKNYVICLMCAEKDPMTCHRTVLVSHAIRNLYKNEINIEHIQENALEQQEHLDRRIMNKFNMDTNNLLIRIRLQKENKNLNSRELNALEMITRRNEAYRKQGKEIAYKLDQAETS